MQSNPSPSFVTFQTVPCKLHVCCQFKVLHKVLEPVATAKSRGTKHDCAVPNTNTQRKEDRKTIQATLDVRPVILMRHHATFSSKTNCCTFGSAPTGWRFPPPQLSPSIATEAFQAAPLTPVVVGRIVGECGGRQSTLPCIQSAHNSQGRNSHKPGLFITRIGMAAYIQWRRIPERSHHINKVVYHVKSAFSPRSRSTVHS